jgi:transposase InsO family protein
MIIVDDFSRFVWVKYLRYKSEATSKFVFWIKEIQHQTRVSVGGIRSDQGGEFTSLEFIKLCEDNGIFRQLTNAETLEYNGITRHMNRTLLEKTRSMQQLANSPKFL